MSEETEEKMFTIDQKSNLQEVRQFLGTPDAEALSAEILRKTLSSCLAMMINHQQHIDEHMGITRTLRESNKELQRVISDDVKRENSLQTALEQLNTLHEHLSAPVESVPDVTTVWEERINILKAEHTRVRSADVMLIRTLKQQLRSARTRR